MADKIKLFLAVLVLGSGIVAFYYFGEYSVLLRALGMLAAVIVAGAIALQAESGAAALAFVRSAMVEVRKVVWPSRDETVKTTGVVVVMVISMGIIMWAFDVFLNWAVKLLTGQGG